MTPTTYRYTGQRWEVGLGLYFYRARWYDPALGRWLSPDTIVPQPGNPQSLNRYSYAYNRPLVYVDQDGHFPWPAVAIVLVAAVCVYAYLSNPPTVYAPEANWTPPPTPENPTYPEMRVLEVAPGTETLSDFYATFSGHRLFSNDPQNPSEAAFFLMVPLVGGGIRSVLGISSDVVDDAADVARATGQRHHMLSGKIMDALDEHQTLRGLFDRNDLIARAADKESHWGYQTWHRLYDDEVVRWLTDPAHAHATREEFLSFLYDLYSRPDMLKRFPDALKLLQEAQEVVP